MIERTLSEEDRRRYVSVAVSFGDTHGLLRLGSSTTDLACPACGAIGRRYGNPGEELRFEGFEPLSQGGLLFILARCARCSQRVTLPHRRA